MPLSTISTLWIDRLPQDTHALVRLVYQLDQIKTWLASSDHRASLPSKLDLRLSFLSSKEEIHGLVSPHCIFSEAMRLIQIMFSVRGHLATMKTKGAHSRAIG